MVEDKGARKEENQFSLTVRNDMREKLTQEKEDEKNILVTLEWRSNDMGEKVVQVVNVGGQED